MRIEKPWEYSFCDQCTHCVDDDMCNAYTLGMSNVYCPQIRDCDKFQCDKKLHTNADRIRAMSDEELAKAIASKTYTGACNDFDIPYDGKCCHNCEKCDAIIKWLKQPAE